MADTENNQAAPEGTSTAGDGVQSTATQEHSARSDLDVGALQKEIDALKAERKKLREEAKSHREAKEAEAAAKLEAARKAGELEPVVQSLEAKLAEREHLASFGERALKRLEERVTRDLEKVPPDVRERIERFGDVEQRADALDLYLAAAGQKKPTTAVPIEGAPAGPPNTLPSIDSLLAKGLSIDTIKRDHPEVWEAQKGRFQGKAASTGAGSFLRFVRK